ncbi:thioredoxin family protein [Sutcliffiella halmapala]|uniref:thioredoxin family protein n=1 Tax=Sutcliffiella halmapala TaxID=79882 RepID=UPI000995019C|nr:thioredoxin family protein [Sutcliffiella halmapala]
MKKIIVIVSIIVAIFVALAVITNYQQKKSSEGNPYGKDKIKPSTQQQLNDPLYQNLILPDQLEEKLENGETTTVYFYSPECVYCQQTSPVIVPMAEEMDINLELYNILEFEQGWADYNIHSTPTIIHFENGKEIKRLEKYYQDHSVYSNWFEDIKETPSE